MIQKLLQAGLMPRIVNKLMEAFWNNKALNQVIEYVRQKQKELYQYSLEMGYIDNTITFEQFLEY